MKKLASLLIAGALALPCATTSAGTRADYPLTANLTAVSAAGAIGSVRKGGLAGDGIACHVESGQITAGDLYVECDVNTSTGSKGCYSSAPTLIAVAQSIHADSYISFSATTANCPLGCCLTNLAVFNGSIFYPTQL